MEAYIKIISITVWQKDAVTHTKFNIVNNGIPFPIDNFRLAMSWVDQGLCNDSATEFMRSEQKRLEMMK